VPPTPVRVAIVVFDGFSELDTFITFGLLNRLGASGWKAELAAPAARVTSMGGVTVDTPRPLEFANEADAVLFPGGLYLRAIAENSAVIDRLALDPLRQLVGGQCSGTLMLARLGLLADLPAATDTASKPWMVQAGVRVADDTPFLARGPVATAGGAFAAHYLATWLMCRRAGLDAATQALQQAAPVGQKDDWTERLLAQVRPYLSPADPLPPG
jgi:transcriptional regulator GlxA family with amidase domain